MISGPGRGGGGLGYPRFKGRFNERIPPSQAGGQGQESAKEKVVELLAVVEKGRLKRKAQLINSYPEKKVTWLRKAVEH